MSRIPDGWRSFFNNQKHFTGNYNMSITSRCFSAPSMLPCDLGGIMNNAEITVDVAAAMTQSSNGARWRWPGTPFDPGGGVPMAPWNVGYNSGDGTVAPGGDGLTGPPTPWDQPNPRIHGYACEDGYCCAIDGTRSIIVMRFSPNEDTAMVYASTAQGIKNPGSGPWYGFKVDGPPFQPDGGEFPIADNSPHAVHCNPAGTTLATYFPSRPGQTVISRRMMFYDGEIIRQKHQDFLTNGHSDSVASTYKPYRIAPMVQRSNYVITGADKLNTPKCVFDPVKRWLYVMQPQQGSGGRSVQHSFSSRRSSNEDCIPLPSSSRDSHCHGVSLFSDGALKTPTAQITKLARRG
jgi:hypothetical protein